MSSSLLREGKNYWRKGNADQGAFLVDAADYYQTLAEVFEKAQKSIYIVGWDVGAHAELRKNSSGSTPTQLGPLLAALVKQKPELEVYVLCWNYPSFYAIGRELSFSLNPAWESHERLHLHLDDVHPIGASHHQKIVVVDDQIAFSGGLDLCVRRWDTSRHQPQDPLRKDHHGHAYNPFHDVQMMVSGPVAQVLGDWVRERWLRSIQKKITPPKPSHLLAWPESVPVEFEKMSVAISLTYPHFGGFREQREIEAITVDALRSARRCIYIENQYLTSRAVKKVLQDLLKKPEGPEIVVLLSSRAVSLMELCTMGIAQNILIKKLRRLDRYRRLEVFYPQVPGLHPAQITMHSKIIVIDDDFAKVGSSNLNNRSMGFDSECDLSIESEGKPAAQVVIAGLRNRLLGEHLGMEPAAVAQQLSSETSLLQFIRAQQHRGRSLQPVRRRTPLGVRWLGYQEKIFDPKAPLMREQLISDFLHDEAGIPARTPILGVLFVGLTLLLLAALWGFAPIVQLRAELIGLPHFSRWVLLAFAVGGASLVPSSLLILLALNFLGLKEGLFYGWIGVILAAHSQYLMGRLVPDSKVRTLVYRRLNGLGQKLARLNAMPSFVLRFLPITPVSVLSLVSGASRMPLIVFFFMSVLGTIPFLLVLGTFQFLLEFLARSANPATVASVLTGLALAFFVWMFFDRRGRNGFRSKA